MNAAIQTTDVRRTTGALVPLEHADDPALCGHKAATLAELLRQGFEVPAGFVIPVGATLARRIEAVRGAPQDVEWARAGGTIFVLQARAITALPVAPQFERPKGTWEKDAAHFPEPVCAFAASTHLSQEMAKDLLPDVGLVPDRFEAGVIGHEFLSSHRARRWWGEGAAVVGDRHRRAGVAVAAPQDAARRRTFRRWLLRRAAPAVEREARGRAAGRAATARAGTYRGRVRVITSVHQLHLLQRGEVLVCPSTSAAWMMVFHCAGALVTDFGSVLTHTSIVAREHRLPAVVGTHCATAALVDGDEVIVDGTQGTVTRVS